MKSIRDGSLQVSSKALLASVIVITPAALGVHEIMLEGLNIPYPRPVGLPAWASFADAFLSVIGLIVFCRLASERLARLPWLMRAVVVGLLFAMLRETFRVIVIDGELSSAWLFQALSGAPGALCLVAIGAAASLAADGPSRSRAATVGASFLIAAAGMFAVRPLLVEAFGPLLQALSFLDHPQTEFEPYSAPVFAVIYVTFAEPVVAALAMAALVRRGLSAERAVRLAQFTLMIVVIKGRLLPTLLFSFWIDAPLARAMLSESQFALETVALALMAGVAWPLCERDARG